MDLNSRLDRGSYASGQVLALAWAQLALLFTWYLAFVVLLYVPCVGTVRIRVFLAV